jgi:hypothetical protein
MSMSRSNCGVSLLVLTLALALVGTGWAQAAKPTSPDHAILYKRAVGLLDQAQQKLNAGDLAGAKSLVKQSNSLFTLLKKEYATALTERQLSPKEDQQLAINQKLADDTRAEADRLMGEASAKDKKVQEFKAQGRETKSKSYYRQSKEEYNQAQNLYIKSSIYALRNQQRIFRFLTP